MKIVQFTAENVKKLKVVDITPSAGLNQITGKNGQGKTSVLDSIWWALGGSKGIQDVPIRKGAESGKIRLDLGDMIVERQFLASGATTLTVRNPVGAEPGTPDSKLPKWNSPQEILDALVGRLSFDPLAFAHAKPKDQYDTLKTVAEITVDIEALEAQNVADFKARTDVNRDAKQKRAQADGYVIPKGLPAEPIDESGLLNQMQGAAEHNAAIETRKARREQAQRDVDDKKAAARSLAEKAADLQAMAARRIADLRAQIDTVEADAEGQIKALEAQGKSALVHAADLETQLAAAPPLPEPIDVAALRAELDAAKVANAAITKRAERDAILAQVKRLDAEAAALTDAMAKREAEKADAIANAKMPVDGLSLSAGRVWLNGLPFEQASDAEILRTSVAVAMAGNPKLRVIRMRDGSLLDDDGIKMIADMAAEKDYQIWLERVDSTGKIGIVMEDGAVASDNR